jgi:hypothetical protein
MEEVVAKLSKRSRGLVVAQVFPNPFHARAPLVADYQTITPESKRSFRDFEGYVTARAFAELLRRCGTAPTRKKFLEAVISATHLDVDGMRLNYSGGRKYGSKQIELSIVDEAGKILQ